MGIRDATVSTAARLGDATNTSAGCSIWPNKIVWICPMSKWVCTPDGWVTGLHVKAYGPLPVVGYRAAPKYEYMIGVSTSKSSVDTFAAHIDGAGHLWLCG